VSRYSVPGSGGRAASGGRSAHVSPGVEYQATTTQLCGLFPFVAGSGTPAAGTPVGRHLLWGEVVCLDPLAWLRVGLVTNPGVFVLGQPGTGKSALVKRLVTGAVAVGTKVLILGDTNPTTPRWWSTWVADLAMMTGPQAQQLRWEARSQRLALLMALATLIRGERITNPEEVVLGRAIDLLDDRATTQTPPTVTGVLRVIEEGPDTLRNAARADSRDRYLERVGLLLVRVSSDAELEPLACASEC
jgi:hypothetical protein